MYIIMFLMFCQSYFTENDDLEHLLLVMFANRIVLRYVQHDAVLVYTKFLGVCLRTRSATVT